MERLRQVNIKDKGIKLFDAVVSVAKKFGQDLHWDLVESQEWKRFPLPEEIDLEAEKVNIVHREECWVGVTRIMLRESFTTEVIAGGGYTVSSALRRVMQLECQLCEGRGPNLLQEPHLQGIRKDLLVFGNAQREKAKQEWMKKQGGNI